MPSDVKARDDPGHRRRSSVTLLQNGADDVGENVRGPSPGRHLDVFKNAFPVSGALLSSDSSRNAAVRVRNEAVGWFRLA